MIDLSILTWTQQWEFWLITRILRPLEFTNIFRWDFLLVPDQVWLGIGAYRMVKHLFTASGPIMSRFASLGQFLRLDPILFVAFGLVFIADPNMIRVRARIRRINDGGVQAELLDVADIDEALLDELEGNADDTLDVGMTTQLEEMQSANEVILPASVLRPCRTCGRDNILATNLIYKCGHFPFCDECVKKKSCSICDAKGVSHTDNKSQNEVLSVGMTSKAMAKPPGNIIVSENLTIARSCAVCQEREGLLTLMPCGHLLFCGPCVLGFRRCPFCSSRIIRAVRGFDVRHNEIVTNPT